METLQFHELVKSKFAQGLALSRVLPARPRKILQRVSPVDRNKGIFKSYRTGIVGSIHEHRPCVNIFCQFSPFGSVLRPN